MNTNFKVIGLTRLGTKPESTALEADALTTRPSDLWVSVVISWIECCFFNFIHCWLVVKGHVIQSNESQSLVLM